MMLGRRATQKISAKAAACNASARAMSAASHKTPFAAGPRVISAHSAVPSVMVTWGVTSGSRYTAKEPIRAMIRLRLTAGDIGAGLYLCRWRPTSMRIASPVIWVAPSISHSAVAATSAGQIALPSR